MKYLLRIPLGIIDFIQKIFRIIFDSFRSSIRKSITLNYLGVYIFISFIVLLGSAAGGLVCTYFYLENEIEPYTKEIKTLFFENKTEELKDYINKFHDKTQYDIVIYDEITRDASIVNDDSQVDYLPEGEWFEYVKYVYKYLLLPFEYYYNQNFELKIGVLVPANIWTIGAFIIVICVGTLQIFGFLLLWLFGTLKTRKLLNPIYEMNSIAKNISMNNLNLKLNVDNVKYELKDLAITLNDMLGRLNKDFSKQKRFVSNVSHELRTPVAVIGGYANMLGRWGKEDAEVLQESIDAIKNESENMKLLIENLLFLARHDNQTLQYEKEYTRIDILLEEIIKDTEVIDRHHELVPDLEQNINLFVDKLKIKQVLRIFIDNAIKYTPPTGKIYIALKKCQDKVMLSVKDTGIGIDKKDLPNIFNRFYRADKSRNRETGGHGLGLSIAKAIVKEHNGKIIVRSKLGEGSEFKIVL